MANVPQELRYTREHEYVREGDDGAVVIGITDYAQGELGDVVFVDLPKAGTTLEAMEVFGTIEAVKAVSELYSPLAGEVTEVNEDLDADPSVVNRDPYGEGWMIKIRPSDPSAVAGLMDATAYKGLTE